MQIVILTTESLASKLMLTDFNTKTSTGFEAPPNILNSGRVSPGCIYYIIHLCKTPDRVSTPYPLEVCT